MRALKLKKVRYLLKRIFFMIYIDKLLDLGASTKKYNVNEIIFEEGTECYYYYQLVSGSVRWLQVSEDGKEFVQDMIEPGECFGEFPLFDESALCSFRHCKRRV